MALPKADFSRLLRELRRAGPVDRLRLLGRSVASLRGLSPWDRKVLLRMAGFEGAETLVERLAGADRETAQALNRVLAELEEDPGHLDRTVRKLGDPKRRAEAVDELLATLDRVTAEEAQEAAAPAGKVAPTEAAGAPAEEPAAAEPWSDPVAAAGAPTEAPFPRLPVPPPPPPRAAAPSPVAEVEVAEPVLAAAPAAVAPPPPQPPPEATAAAPRQPSAPAPVRQPPAPPPATAPPPEPPQVLEPALPPEAPSAAGTLETLLELRRRLDAGRAPSATELRRLLEHEIPFPWARRRAIQAWLASGSGRDLDTTLGLIETLPPGSDRTWCLASLAGSRPWRDGDWRRILDAAASSTTRRQLELRRRRS